MVIKRGSVRRIYLVNTGKCLAPESLLNALRAVLNIIFLADSAEKIIELDGTEMEGRKLVVNEAKPRAV